MAVSDVFSAHLLIGYEPPVYPNDPVPIYEDITSGIIGVDIEFGTDVYEGPQQQIDTGLFTLVSRNSGLDPKFNSNIVEGATIEFRDSRNAEEGKTNTFFAGYITDIDVQYQRKDDPIITITGTDAFGLLQRTIVSEDIRDFALGWSAGNEGPDINGPSLTTLVSHTSWEDYVPVRINVIDPIVEPTVPGSIDNAVPYNVYLGYNPARYLPDLGETLLEVLNKYTKTNLNYCSIDYRTAPNIVDVYPYAKYNAFFWPPISDPALEFPTLNFSSDPADGRPYESILINNGYNRRTKSLAISNETRLWSGVTFDDPIESTTTSYPPFKVNENDTSVAVGLDTIFATAYVDEDSLDLYAEDIFQVVGFGSDEIQQITFDNARIEDIQNDYTYSFSQLNQFIRIKHQLSDIETINRFYDIAGITHNITPDKWEMGFTFKPAQNEIAFTYQGQEPTIQMNSLTGDSNFNFTATITDFPTETIAEVIWCLNGTNSNVNEQWLASAGTGEIGSRYKDGLQRNGLTQTWNFDDDGILEGPDFPTGGYGTGEWYVIPYIILKNGWVIAPYVMLTVGTPEVDAEFLWSQNLTNNFGQVTFTDDSRNNEIGEPDSYLWNFGDGNTSTLQNPVHVYNPAPDQTTYNVSLRVFAYGVGDEKVFNTRTRTVTLARPTMVPNFTSSANGSIVTFTNTSTNVGFEEPDAYLWDFGDGTTSTLKNPVKTYAGNASVPLTFSVTLTTRNIWEQTATVTKDVTIAALFNTGTLPVTQVRLTPANAGSNYNLMMSYLRCLRSDGTNLSLNATTTRANDPGEVWWQYPGATGDYENPPLTGTGLTRNILLYPNEGGLQFRGGGTTPGYSLNTTISSTQQISNIKVRFDDIFPANDAPDRWWDRLYINLNDSFGGFYPVGYYDLPATPNFAPRQNFGRDYTMTPIRPMPATIPYFKYTFDNTTVSFTSVETADSYAWTFGDGTTSTLKNPVKTYAGKGTYTVTLAVTNGGVVTRTTTEPVIVEAINPFNVRYVKLVQNSHTGTHAFDTPYVSQFFAKFNRNQTVQTNPTPYPVSGDPVTRTVSKAQTYSQEYWSSTGLVENPFVQIDPISATPVSTPSGSITPNRILSWDGSGVRAKSLDGTFRTQWELVQDFQTPINNILEFQIKLARYTVSGFPVTNATGISYSIYITDYLGEPAGIGGATWTHVANLTPTGIPQGTGGQPKKYIFTNLTF
jgi:PKD repeat protein